MTSKTIAFVAALAAAGFADAGSPSPQRVNLGATLTWTTADTEKYEGGTDFWITDGDASALWGNAELLAANRLYILSGGGYAVDRDITVAGIDFAAKAEPVVFDATGRTVTLTASVNPHTKSVVTLQGGTYEMGGHSLFPENDWRNNNRADMTVVLDGAVVTNAGRFVLGYYVGTGDNTVCLTNGATYHQNGSDFWLCYNGRGNNLLRVSAGSRLLLPSAGVVYAHSGARNPSTVIVEGEGSRLVTGDGSSMTGPYGNRLVVRDGASVRVGGWCDFGSGTSVLVSDSDVPSSFSAIYLYGSNAAVRVCRAAANVSALYCTSGGAGARGNTVDVVDGDVVIASCLGDRTSAGDSVAYRLSGTHPKIRCGAVGGSPSGAEFRPRGKIVYDLPLAGYDTDASTGEPIVPFNVQNYCQVDGTCTFEVENLDAIKADMAEKGQTRRSWKIFQWRNITGLSDMLEASNAKYAERGLKFSQIPGTVFIKATVRLPSGGMVIVR